MIAATRQLPRQFRHLFSTADAHELELAVEKTVGASAGRAACGALLSLC